MDRTSIFGLFAIIPILFHLLIFGFSIYFIIRTLKFMDERTKLDQQRKEKLDFLIQAIQDSKRSDN